MPLCNRRGRQARLLAACVGVALLDAPARAVDYWKGDPAAPGDWFDPNNWTAGVPASTETVVIDVGEASLGADARVNYLFLGDQAGKAGALSISGGRLTTNQYAIVGVRGSGTVVQGGTSSHTTGSLHLGRVEGSSGTYRLDDSASLTSRELWIGEAGTGHFRQSGGTNATDFLWVSDAGRLELTGGSLTSGKGLVLRGTVDFGGGAASVSVGGIADFSQGSLLNASAASVTGSAGSLVIFPAGFDPATQLGSFDNAGITHVSGTTLTIPASTTITGRGEINDHVHLAGTIKPPAPFNWISLKKGLTLTTTGRLELGGGHLMVEDLSSGMTGGTISGASAAYVGHDGQGRFAHSAGTHTLTGSSGVYLGYRPGSEGTYELSGTGTLVTGGWQTIGEAGTGTFVQSGGTNRVESGPLYLGKEAGSRGTYRFSGGSLVTREQHVGYGGTGSFIQSAGSTNDLRDYTLRLGSAPTGNGSYELNDSTALRASSQIVGDLGSGTFEHRGGTNTVSHLSIGNQAAGSGWYRLAGGRLISGRTDVGSGGTGEFSHGGGSHEVGTLILGQLAGSHGTYRLAEGGQLKSSGEQYVGKAGTGQFVQSGGTNDLGTKTLLIGTERGSRGNYHLAGGSIKAGGIDVGYSGRGVVVQRDGAVQATSSLYLGWSLAGDGRYELHGGRVQFDREMIGGSGTGALHQSGGTNAVRAIVIDKGGSYVWSGGTLRLNGGIDNRGGRIDVTGPAALQVDGGYLDLSHFGDGVSRLSVTGAPGAIITLPAGAQPASFDNAGTTHVRGTTLSITGNLATVGTIADHVALGGSIVTSWGDLHLARGLSMSSPTAEARVTRLSVENDISGMSAGTLMTGQVSVGRSGTGTFDHRGGTNVVGSDGFYVGHEAGAVGTYKLSGPATLTADFQYVGSSGTGTFLQSGGKNEQGSWLYVGHRPGSEGTYELSGGVMRIASQSIGHGGKGTFRQTEGSNDTGGGWLRMGEQSTASAVYELSGSGRLKAAREYVGIDGEALFRQSGGTNTTDLLFVGDRGRYELSGGTLTVNKGLDGGGLDFAGGTGTLVANGGLIDLADAQLGDTTRATYVGKAGSILILPEGFDPTTEFGSYTNDGRVHFAGSNFVVAAGESLVTQGGIGVHVRVDGAFAAEPGGLINVSRGITVRGGGNVSLGGGELAIEDAVSGMSGGQLQSWRQYVGRTGTGMFVHTGGVNAPGGPDAGSLFLGYAPGSHGTYVLSDAGQLKPGTNVRVGHRGTGLFVQSGGSHELQNRSLLLGAEAGSEGTYVMSGGTLRSWIARVGNAGHGTFVHTGGDHKPDHLYVGSDAGGTGVYRLGGTGDLDATLREQVGTGEGAGLVQQSGGSNTTRWLTIGPAGTYELTGGTLTTTDGLDLHGTLDMAGSDATVAAPTGILDLSRGAMLNVSKAKVTGGANALIILPADFDPAARFGSYANAGITAHAGSEIVVPQGKNVQGAGNLAGRFRVEGKLRAAQYGRLTIDGGLRIAPGGDVMQGDGTLTISDATSGIDGGRLFNFGTRVEGSSQAHFEQTGGDVSINGTLHVGDAADSSGVYTMSGGKLEAAEVRVATGAASATGALRLRGGSATVGGPIRVGAGGVIEFGGGSIAADVIEIDGGTLVGRGRIASPLSFSNGGEVRVDADADELELGSSVAVSGGTLRKTGPGLLRITGPQSHGGGSTLRVSEGRLQLGSDAGYAAGPFGPTLVADDDTSVTIDATQHLAALELAAGARLNVTPGRGTQLVTSRLDLDAESVLDLADGTLVLHADAATRDQRLAEVVGLIRSARNAPSGPWTGHGITSSAAATDPLTGLVAVLNPGFTAFGSEAVDANSVLVTHTYNGDATLDGRVSADDYFRIDAGFLEQPQDPLYVQGDFDYNDKIDADDYFLIDSAFLGQSGEGEPGLTAISVPEPSSGALLLLLGGGLLRRRR